MGQEGGIRELEYIMGIFHDAAADVEQTCHMFIVKQTYLCAFGSAVYELVAFVNAPE